MAGLLNLVPRYLPRYGMAPDWARASRPLVAVFIAICFIVTAVFHADVDAQGGAYATGVLVLMSSAAIAVAISRWRTWSWPFFALVCLIFGYTTISNIIQRPEGIKIAAIFIALILLFSLISRALRSTEFRVESLEFAGKSRQFLDADNDGVIRFIAHRPVYRTPEEYAEHDRAARNNHNLAPDEQLIFLEVDRVDASDFTACLCIEAAEVGGFKILRTSSPAVPNAIAAILVYVQQLKHHNPHVYFKWTEGNPVAHLFRFVFLGEGDVAPVTHEILRKNIPDRGQRPIVHVA